MKKKTDSDLTLGLYRYVFEALASAEQEKNNLEEIVSISGSDGRKRA
jgi:hypothetical protein